MPNAGNIPSINPLSLMRRSRWLRMRVGRPVALGPFSGGINTESDVSAIADTELVDCVNFELDLDSTLKCRPPIKLAPDLSGTWTERIVARTTVVLPSGIYIIGSNTNGTYQFHNGVWTLITNTFKASCVVQYKDKAWLFATPGSGSPGGSWDGTTFVPVAAMPQCQAAVVYKERIYTAPGTAATTNTSRLIFCAVADPTTWNSADFFDVEPGSGQKLVDLVVSTNNLILFKEHSTFGLSYSTKPSDAAITKLSNNIGVTFQHCIVNYQGEIFTYHQGKVYELVNLMWSQINLKVPFVYDPTTPSARDINIFMCLMGQRILVRYYNNIYVFSLKNKVWTRWSSTDNVLGNFGPLVPFVSDPSTNLNDLYYGGSSVLANKNFFVIADGWDSTTAETSLIQCSITTKNYDFKVPYEFKRMYWWGIDAITNRQVTATAFPVVLSSGIPWGSLLGYTWDTLPGTWDAPLSAPVAVTNIVNAGSGTLRRFFKFNKGLRFRLINFQIVLQSDGTLNDGPAHLYTITAFNTMTETVVSAVS